MTKLEQAAQQALEMMDAGSYIPAMRVLREALAEPELNLNCKSVQKRLATVWGYVKAEQAKQSQLADATLKPVGYFAYDEEHDIWEELTGPNAPGATKLYAAPVRTKDLSNEEILKIVYKDYGHPMSSVDISRAVIAADREKNK